MENEHFVPLKVRKQCQTTIIVAVLFCKFEEDRSLLLNSVDTNSCETNKNENFHLSKIKQGLGNLISICYQSNEQSLKFQFSF